MLHLKPIEFTPKVYVSHIFDYHTIDWFHANSVKEHPQPRKKPEETSKYSKQENLHERRIKIERKIHCAKNEDYYDKLFCVTDQVDAYRIVL